MSSKKLSRLSVIWKYSRQLKRKPYIFKCTWNKLTISGKEWLYISKELSVRSVKFKLMSFLLNIEMMLKRLKAANLLKSNIYLYTTWQHICEEKLMCLHNKPEFCWLESVREAGSRTFPSRRAWGAAWRSWRCCRKRLDDRQPGTGENLRSP